MGGPHKAAPFFMPTEQDLSLSILDALKALGRPATRKEIAARVGVQKTSAAFTRALNSLEFDGALTCAKYIGAGNRYNLTNHGA